MADLQSKGLTPEPEIAEARRRIIAARNRMTALALVAMAVLFFAITLVKMPHLIGK